VKHLETDFQIYEDFTKAFFLTDVSTKPTRYSILHSDEKLLLSVQLMQLKCSEVLQICFIPHYDMDCAATKLPTDEPDNPYTNNYVGSHLV